MNKFFFAIIISSLIGVTINVYDDNIVFICTEVATLLTALYGLSIIALNPEYRGNFFIIASSMILFGSSSGVLFSYISFTSLSYKFWEDILSFTPTTLYDITMAQVNTNCFAIILLLTGNRLQKSGIIKERYQQTIDYIALEVKLLTIVIVLISICQVWLYLSGDVLYGGRDLEAGNKGTSPLQALIVPFVPIVPFVSAYYLRVSFKSKIFRSIIFYSIILLIELFWHFLFGRRSIIFLFLLAFFGFFMRDTLSARFLLRNIFPIAIVLYSFLLIADLYHKIRVVHSFENAQHMDIVEAILGSATENDEYAKVRNENIATRSSYSALALAKFHTIFRTTDKSNLNGEELINSLLFSTPSDFFVSKQDILVKEHLYEQAYSLALVDISETLYLEAFIDFGWVGLLVYPLFILLTWYPIYKFSVLGNRGLLPVVVTCVSMMQAFSMIEIDMITYLVSIRTLMICCVLSIFFSKSRQFNYSRTNF